MSHLFIEELDYQRQSFYRQRIAELAYPCILDSGHPIDAHIPANTISPANRFDVLTAVPKALIKSEAGSIYIKDGLHGESAQQAPWKQHSGDDPYHATAELLADYPTLEPDILDVPFRGGAMGYFAYDLYTVTRKDHQQSLCEDMWLGIYLWAVVIDHAKARVYFLARPEFPSHLRQAMIDQLTAESDKPQNTDYFALTSGFTSNLSQADYEQAFKQAIDYIRAGDCYQINLAQRYQASYEGNEWTAYQRLRTLAPVPFGGFLKTEKSSMLCFSPERFVSVTRHGEVETRPIKGTRRRSDNPHEDEQLGHALVSSQKDLAENLMIVDLLRNDLSKNCELHSVHVPELFRLEKYTNVQHLVSIVKGQLEADKSSLDLLAGCFPGGSITGAPKRRAMEIIHELEPHPRSVYCGSLGYIGFDGSMDTNILIRTLLCSDSNLYCWGGGGIVADSIMHKEYEESVVKVANLLAGLEANISGQSHFHEG